MINWTKEQLEIIEDKDHNLIVSAAAGSGKTAVLIERIFRLLKNKEVSANNILMITFTIKAAREMKEKLQNKLEEALLENYDEYLAAELKNLETADIKTIDAFCHQVVKDNYSQLDLDIRFQILDDYNKNILAEQATDLLFEEEYQKNDPLFLKNLKIYTNIKSDQKLRDLVQSIYGFARSTDEPLAWLENSLSSYTGDLNMFKDTILGNFYFNKIMIKEFRKYDHYLEKMKEAVVDGAFEYQPDYDQIENQYREKKQLFTKMDIESFFSCPIAFTRLKSISKDKKNEFHLDYAKYRDLFKKFNDEFKKDLAQKLRYLASGKEEALYLIELVKSFGNKLMELKRNSNAFDFNDIEHFALEILKNEDIRKSYQNYYEYIFVDEYQDSNSLQEKIFSQIKRNNNIFYVGDIKQSIYRFRLADSGIFLKTIKDFEARERCKSLTLNRNFRSSNVVVAGINSIFNHIMDGDISPVKYKEEAQLVFASGISLDNKIETYILDNFKDYTKSSEGDLAEEFNNNEKTIQEAIQCASKIRKLVDEGHYQYQDFVILGRSVDKIFTSYKKVFDQFGIPLYGEGDTGFSDSLIVALIIDYLELIDNINNDLALINVLKSPIYALSLDDLGLIRFQDENRYDNNFIKSIMLYLKSERTSATIENKLKAFLADLEYFKEVLNFDNLMDFIIKVLMKTRLYFLIYKNEDYLEESMNVNELLKIAGQYEADNQNHLNGFLKSFKAMKKREIAMASNNLYSEKGNVVRMQTIHKSKGLEYKNVFIVKLGDNLQYSTGNSIFYHKELGLGTLTLNEDDQFKVLTLAQEIISKAKEYEDIEDYYNLLYVAMTRAQENLFLIGTYSKFEEKENELKSLIYSLNKPKNYYELILPYILNYEDVANNYKLISINEPLVLPDYKKEGVLLNNQPDEDIEVLAREVVHIPKKLTATDFVAVNSLNKALTRDLLKGEIKIKPDFLAEKKIGGVEKGILFHLMMEVLDFSQDYTRELLEKTLNDFQKKGMLTENELKALDINGLMGFFESELYQRLRKADYYEKEKAFNILISPKLLNPDYQGSDNIMVQGIIDLFFVEAGKGVLIDYKTDQVDENNIMDKVEGYKKQLLLYKEALVNIKGLIIDEAYLYFSREKKSVEVKLGGLYD